MYRYQLSGQYQAVATIMLNIYQLSRQRLLLCWICNSCQDSSCYSAEYVPLPAVKTAAAIGRYCSRCTSCQYSSWYAAEYVPAVKTAAAILLKMYHLSRQQLIWCWRCTSCQDSICYSAEDIPAVKTAADMLLKMYQLSRQQLPSYWRCTSCQDSSQNRSYFLFCWRAVKTAVPAHKTEAASLLKIYQLSRQKLLFCRRCTSWHAPAFFVKLKLNPWVARCTLSLSKCTLVLPPTPLLRGIGYRYI